MHLKQHQCTGEYIESGQHLSHCCAYSQTFTNHNPFNSLGGGDLVVAITTRRFENIALHNLFGCGTRATSTKCPLMCFSNLISVGAINRSTAVGGGGGGEEGFRTEICHIN